MNINRINKLARWCGITVAMALLAGVAGMVNAQEKGATRLLRMGGTTVEPKSTPSDYKPMSCPKCQDKYVRRVDWRERGAKTPTVLVRTHLCQSCRTKWIDSGHGKAKTSTAIHICKSCGSDDVACCSTSKSSVAVTKGMEKQMEATPVK